jgi:hypothetical protein
MVAVTSYAMAPSSGLLCLTHAVGKSILRTMMSEDAQWCVFGYERY